MSGPEVTAGSLAHSVAFHLSKQDLVPRPSTRLPMRLDAVDALMDQYGALASDHPDVAAGASTSPGMHGGDGLLPGDRVHDLPDGLSPAGTMCLIRLDQPRTLQDYGCALPESTRSRGVGTSRKSRRTRCTTGWCR